MFAIISHKGNQYKVSTGREYKIDLLDSEPEDKKIVFPEVMLVSNDGKNTIGNPFIEGASVEGEMVGNISDKKVGVFKFHSKKRYTRNHGHRQKYTVVKILKVNTKNEK